MTRRLMHDAPTYSCGPAEQTGHPSGIAPPTTKADRAPPQPVETNLVERVLPIADSAGSTVSKDEAECSRPACTTPPTGVTARRHERRLDGPAGCRSC